MRILQHRFGRAAARPVANLCFKGRSVLAGALFALGLVVGLAAPTDVKASLFYPGDPGFLTGFTITPTLTLTPFPFQNAVYSNDSNTDVGNQSPANVQTILQSEAWFDTGMIFIGGGACGEPGVTCTGGAGTITLSGAFADVFAIHFDNQFIAFLYDTPISNFSISGLPLGTSNIYAYLVPLPAALPLFLSALAGLGLMGWRRQQAGA